MENKVLDKNLARIAQYDKDLSDKILMTDIEKSNLKLSKTNFDEYNLIFNDTELHDSEGAQLEALKIVKNDIQNINGIKIVYGLGLGYLPDAIVQICPEAKVIIYEPNLEILKLVLSIAQIDALYKENVFLSSDIESFKKLVKQNITSDTKITVNFLNSYKNMFGDDIKNIHKQVQNILNEAIANKNTYMKKMPLASLSSVLNLRKIITSPNIAQFKNIYKDKTALILCAGPSLSDNIEIIKKNKDKFITFALNPTLKLLQKHSIVPDFVVDIDVFDNKKQFQDIDLSNSYLITDAFTYFEVIYLNSKKNIFYISDENFFNYWLINAFEIKNPPKDYGTCSYVAFQCALTMGFKKIILIGQDLAFKNGKCYASGSQYDNLECVFNEEKQKYEIIPNDMDLYLKSYANQYVEEGRLQEKAMNFLETLNQNLKTVKDKNGNLIPTKADYEIFIRIFEDAAKEINDIELINSSDGAKIEGFKDIALDEALKNAESVEKIDLTTYKPNYNFVKAKKEIEILHESLIETQKTVDDFVDIAKKLLKELQIKKTITDNASKLIVKYKDNFNKIIEQFDKNKDIGNILSCNAYEIYELLKTDYYKDSETLITALNKIIPVFELMKTFIKYFVIHSDIALANCEAFIL